MKTMPATQVAGVFIMGFVRDDGRDQGALFPVSLDKLVPQDHGSRVIDTRHLREAAWPGPTEKPVDVSVY